MKSWPLFFAEIPWNCGGKGIEAGLVTQESFLCFICNVCNALYKLTDLASKGSLVKTIHVESMTLNGMKEFGESFLLLVTNVIVTFWKN